MKSEPSAYSIEDLERDGTTNWEGVRNYQARNFMREMKSGDKVLFYASSAEPSGVSGLAVVSRDAQPEPRHPDWSMVELKFAKKFPNVIPLETLKSTRGLEDMKVVQRGMRLSVQPVTKAEYDIVVKLAK